MMGLRPEVSPAGSTKESRASPCASADEDDAGGGTVPSTTATMGGIGGVRISEHLSKMGSRPNTAPPS
jgi:hypothetical protein